MKLPKAVLEYEGERIVRMRGFADIPIRLDAAVSSSGNMAVYQRLANKVSAELYVISLSLGDELIARCINEVSVRPSRDFVFEKQPRTIEVKIRNEEGDVRVIGYNYLDYESISALFETEGKRIILFLEGGSYTISNLAHETTHAFYGRISHDMKLGIKEVHDDLINSDLIPMVKSGATPDFAANHLLSWNAFVDYLDGAQINKGAVLLYKGFVGKCVSHWNASQNYRNLSSLRFLRDSEEFFCELIAKYLVNPAELKAKNHKLVRVAQEALEEIVGKGVDPLPHVDGIVYV